MENVWLCLHRYQINLTKVRPLFTLSHRGSDNSPLIKHRVQCDLYWPFNRYFYATESKLNDFCHLQKYCTEFKIRYLVGRNHDAMCKYKVHTKFTWTQLVMGSYQILYAIVAKIRYLVGRNHDAMCKYKVYTKFTWTQWVMGSYQILYAIVIVRLISNYVHSNFINW